MPVPGLCVNVRLPYIVGLLPFLIAFYFSFTGFDTASVSLLAIVCFLLSIFTVILASRKMPKKHALTLIASGLILTGAIPFTHWPLRLSFALSWPFMNQLANRLEAGEKVAPQWAGVFYIRRAEINHRGMAVLWINLADSGFTGFARPSDDVAIGKFNDWSDYRLWGNWHHIAED